MAKKPEEIQKDLIERFGLQIDIEKCKNYSQAYSVISNLATIGYINVVNEGKLKNIVGKREDFQRALNENEHIENKSIKAFYFHHYSHMPIPIGKDRVATIPLNDSESRKPNAQTLNAINLRFVRIANDFGLVISNEALEKLVLDKNITNENQVDEKLFLDCALENNNMYNFKVVNQWKAYRSLERLSFNLGEYKDKFADNFLGSHAGSRLRNNANEDTFLRVLDEKGIYITYVDKKLEPITNMEELKESLRNDSDKIKIVGLNRINIYEQLGEYIIEEPEFEGLLATNISNTILSERTEEHGVKSLRTFEESYGLKLYYYNTDIIAETSTDKIIGEIVAGNAKFLVCDIEKFNEKIKVFPMDIQKALHNLIKEKESGLSLAQKKLEEQRLREAEQKEEQEVQFLNTKTDSEKKIHNIIEETYKAYGEDYTIYALASAVRDNTLEEFVVKDDEISNEEMLKGLTNSYVKRVLQRMKEKNIANNANVKENLLEKAIVEIYQSASSSYDMNFVVDFISNCLSEKILGKKDNIFPEGTLYSQDVNDNISKTDILKILIATEIDEELQENHLGSSLRKYKNLEDRLELSENRFINNTMKRATTSTEKSSMQATIYASLSQNGADENAKIVDVIKKHKEINEEIKKCREELLKTQILFNKEEKDTLEYERLELAVEVLKEKLQKKMDEYEQFMIQDKFVDKNKHEREKVMVIGEYESRIIALKALEEERSYLNKSMKSEVVEI